MASSPRARRRSVAAWAPRVLALGALAVTAACGGADVADDSRVAELERRVERLERRLADLPAGPEDLRDAEVEELLQRLDSPDPVARWQAASALAERSGDDRGQLARVLTLGTSRQQRAAALALAGQATAEDLPLLLLAHGTVEGDTNRALLVTALGHTRAEGAVDAVVADLGHPARKVRLAAVQALGSLRAPRSTLALLETVFADEPVLSDMAAETVAGLGPEALVFVDAAWPRWDPRQRRRALEVVGGLEGAESDEFLSARLDDADAQVALEAALSLARRGDERARGGPGSRGQLRSGRGAQRPRRDRRARQTLTRRDAG